MTEPRGSVGLRPLELGDIARVLEWRNRPEVARYMYTDHVISEREHARWFGSAMSNEDRRYWIIELDGEPVGVANLYDISTSQNRAYVALYVADEQARGAGVGSAADRLLIQFAFEDLGLAKVCAEVLATNEAGIKVHQHHGFRIDGVLREHVVKSGIRTDVVTMSLLRGQWTDEGAAARSDP